tara:strand:+ start:66 stop:206 length:141 start_codon:yes stop_codon:yes gene_type:complete
MSAATAITQLAKFAVQALIYNQVWIDKYGGRALIYLVTAWVGRGSE